MESWKFGGVYVLFVIVVFGVGIDKLDVRFVIYYSVLKDLESYV